MEDIAGRRIGSSCCFLLTEHALCCKELWEDVVKVQPPQEFENSVGYLIEQSLLKNGGIDFTSDRKIQPNKIFLTSFV